MNDSAGKTGPREARIAILGGGFAGLAAALELPPRSGVTLIDANSSFEFLPNIHELVSGVKDPAALRLPRREILQRAGHQFLRDRVTAIHADEGRVEFEKAGTLRYDALIVALGGVNANHGVPGVSEHAMPFKSVDDCARIGARLTRLSERCEAGQVEDIVVVGGGLEGIEALGEILRAYRRQRCFRIRIVEARERLLPEAPAALDRMIRDLCAPYDKRSSKA
jgi:NADH dehydrogenase